MPNDMRETLLTNISNWTTSEIVTLLEENNLSDCCGAIVKRRIDGEEFLHLSEGSLNLWKDDLPTPLRGNLCRFVAELIDNPEQYCQERKDPTPPPSGGESEAVSDTDLWDTDFEDDFEPSKSVNEDSSDSFEMYTFDNSRPRSTTSLGISKSRMTEEVEDEDDNIYENGTKLADRSINLANNPTTSNGPFCIATELAECLKQRRELNVKPAVGPKPLFVNRKPEGAKFSPKKLEGVKGSKNNLEVQKGVQKNAENPSTNKVEGGKLSWKMTEDRKALQNKPVGETPSWKKPEIKNPHRNESKEDGKPNELSFLHMQQPLINKIITTNNTINPQSTPGTRVPRILPPDLQFSFPPKPNNTSKARRDLPKPPSSSRQLLIGNLDLVADLPQEKADESDEYEPIKEHSTVQQPQNLDTIRRVNSSLSSESGRSIKGSSESVYRPPSIGSSDEHQDADVYESINEQPNGYDDRYVRPILSKPSSTSLPRPLPARPSPTSSLEIGRQLLGGLGSRLADEVADMIVRIKRGLLRCCHAQPSESPEPPEPPTPPGDLKRSVSLNTAARRQASLSECLTQAALTQARENLAKRSAPTKFNTFPYTDSASTKFDTFPSTGNQSSDKRAANRPLPPTPAVPRPEKPVEISEKKFDVPSYTEMPWYHNIKREDADALISKASSQFRPTSIDGYFLMRPSNRKTNQPWTLVLWYKSKVWNIGVRERRDARYALGTPKPGEASFGTIEELVSYYRKNELVLNSCNGDGLAGRTILTDTPPKKKD